MSHNPQANEIVRTLTLAVRQALDSSHGEELPAARDVAQILGFDGLDRALSVWRAADPGTAPIARQLRDLCERSEAEGSVEPFIVADAELGRLAVECGSVIEGEPGSPPEGTLGAGDALGDLPLDDASSLAVAMRVRLSPQVSAALRAAIDWLNEPGSTTPGARLRTEDSALELTLPRVNPAGLGAAAKVLAAVGGNLGPAGVVRGTSAAWAIRVPIVTARETFLMVSQGDLDLALPWHAVLRVTMTPRAAFDSHVGALGLPVLPPLVPLSGTEADCPLILVAHGLRRAYVVADRLVWRLPAETFEIDADPRAPGHPRCVRTEDDELYRVVDPARLLEGVAPIATPEHDHAIDLSLGGTPDDMEHEEFTPAGEDSTTPMASIGAHATALAEDDDADLAAPVPDHALPAAEHALPAAEDVVLPVLDAARVMPLPLRALVAEDSISARLALTQMLEANGMEVHAVGTAGELFDALEEGPWAMVCVDTELPDGRGVEMLNAARARARDLEPDVEVVALVRDGAESAMAIAARIVHTLRKPWGRAAVARLLADLDLESENS